MMQPCADVIERVKFWVIGKNDATPTEATWLKHDLAPVTKKVRQVSATLSRRSIGSRNKRSKVL
jgi:hypothetical protein